SEEQVEHHEETADAEQRKPRHCESRDGSAVEGEIQGAAQATAGSLGDPHVRSDRDVHADVTADRGKQRADTEACSYPDPLRAFDPRLAARHERKAEHYEDGHDGNSAVLAVHVS